MKTSLDFLIREHQEKITTLINDLRGKIVVFDFDGTITEFNYGENSILPCDENDLNEYSISNNMYENARIPYTIRYIIDNLDKNNIYILTKSIKNTQKHKIAKILKEFEGFDEKHIIQVDSYEAKSTKILELHKNFNKEIVFFEDTADVLISAERDFDFVRAIHTSNLLF